jgi:hypothetical protein
VNVNYFIAFERTSEEIESELQHFMEQLSIPQSTWHEFSDLSIEAQGAMVDALRRVLAPSVASLSRHQAAEISILANGVRRSLPLLERSAIQHGLSAVDFARHRTQIEEVAGDRFIMLDRMCTLPASWLFDQLQVFRGMFGVEPQDPLLLKWWIRAQRSAFLQTVKGHESRAIYPIDRVANYLRTGQWGTHLWFEPEVVRSHVKTTIEVMRSHSSYRVGLVEGDIPIRIFAKDAAGVLVMMPTDNDIEPGADSGIALRFSGPHVTAQFRAYFDEIWDSIPEARKDTESVVAWLESQLDSTGGPV